MSDDAMGDEVYQPTASDHENLSNEPDLENSLEADGGDETEEERGYSPPEKPLAVDHYGTTAEEQHDGESLDRRLAEEVPDVHARDGDGVGDQPGQEGEPLDPEVGGARSGRLVAEDPAAPYGSDDDVFAEDVGIDSAAATAEEAAMHEVDDDETLPGPPPAAGR